MSEKRRYSTFCHFPYFLAWALYQQLQPTMGFECSIKKQRKCQFQLRILEHTIWNRFCLFFAYVWKKKCPTVHFRQRGGGAFKKVAPLYQNKFAWRNLKKKAKIGSGLLGRRCQDSKVHDFFCSSGGNNYPLLKYWSGGNIGHIFLSGGRSIGKQEGGYLNPWPG